MTIDWNIAVQIAAPIVSLFIGALLNHFLTNRERLISHYGHVSGFKLAPIRAGDEPTYVNTHSIIVKNSGRKTATNVRIGHVILPDIKVYPDIQYSILDLPGGGKEILIPKLIPKKEVTISYLYFAPTTYNQINTYVESDECPAKIVNVLLQPQPPKWLIKLIWVLIVYGIVGIIYTAYESIKIVAM